MAQQKRKTSSTKKNSQTRKPRTSKSKKKKPKVFIPTDKIIILCSIVVILCTILLFLNTTMESNVREKPVSVPKEQVYSQKNNSSKNNSTKNNTASKNNANSKKSSSSKEQSKTSSSSGAQQKQEKSQKQVAQESKSKTTESVKKETVTPVVEEKKSVPEVKKQPEEKKEVVVSKYDYLPKAVNNAKLVFVFDDAGQNMNHLEKFMNLPFPITVAVLPKLTYSRAAADRIRKAGKEVILHQPMQALNLNVNPGPGAITPDMSLYEIEMLVKENIAEVGSISGMNNHEGSMITEDENRISFVMQTLSDMGLYFLDSRTTSQTRVPQAAMSLGLSYYERNVFIDNTQNISDMVKEIEKGLNIANQKGLAIMIGHIWSANTLPNLLMELYPVLVKKGYKFTTVSKSGGLITP